MLIRNTRRNYGMVAILLHWSMALLIIGLFVLGLYMTGLDYYSPWYRTAPDIHRSLGVIVALLLIARLIWRIVSIQPEPEPLTPRYQALVAEWMHRLIYLLVMLIIISGYLISTADGRSVNVFGVLEIPSLISGIANMEDLAGEIHFILATSLMSLVAVHVAAAVKHHVVDKDRTLIRMLISKSDSR